MYERLITDSIYPLTIMSDRYNGTYSGGKYTAWNLDPDEIPTAIYGSDNECLYFWIDLINKRTIPYGVGNTIEEAVGNLYLALIRGDLL